MNWRKQIILMVVLVAAILAVGWLARHTGNASALNRLKAELRAKGEKLTFSELALPLSTNAEEIASRQFFMTNLDVTKNGFQPADTPIQFLKYVSAGKARIAWRGRLHLDINIPVFREWTDFDRQNEKWGATLDQIRQALQHPPPDTGWIYEDTFQNNKNSFKRQFRNERNLAYDLAQAEVGALHRGDLNVALSDLHALIGLAERNRNELNFTSQIVRTAVAALGLSATWEALQSPGWDEPQLAALQHHWEQINLYEVLEKGSLTQRAYCQMIMQTLRQSKSNENWGYIPMDSKSDPLLKMVSHTPLAGFWEQHMTPLVYRMFSLNGDELFQLSYWSKEVEMCRLLKSNRPWPEIKAMNSMINSNMQAELDGKFSGMVLFHNYMASAAILPNFFHAPELCVHTETQRRLTITAIALKRYELKHGQPPSSLARLVPDFLVEVPLDPMSDKELCYRLNPDSTFVLYSVGEDGKDDGGQPGMGLWEGKDAVWPTAVTQD